MKSLTVYFCQCCDWLSCYLTRTFPAWAYLAAFLEYKSTTDPFGKRSTSLYARWTYKARYLPKLRERFGEHRRSILNHQQLSTITPVSLHFNQAGHSINDVCLISIELIRCKRDLARKPLEAHLINKAKTLHPFGITAKEMKHASDISDTYLIIAYQSLSRIFI